MSIKLAVITIVVLLSVAFSLYNTYGVKSLLHPGLYFCVLWAVGVGSYLILSNIQNQLNIFNLDHVNELNGYVLFTAVLFWLFKGIGRQKVLKSPSIWRIHHFLPLFRYIAIVALVSAIVMFIIRAATLDFTATRDANVEFETALFYGERYQTLLFTIFGIFLSSNIILGVFAGFIIGEQFGKRIGHSIGVWILLLPVFTQIVMMLTVGGRIDFINILRAYIFGISISIANGIRIRKLWRMYVILLSLVIIFSIYSNYNYEQRTTRSRYLDDRPFLNQFSSIMEYFSSVYTGYQLRRDDFVSEKLEYGEKTFAGIIFFRIPFAGTLGLKKSSVGEYFELEEYTMKKMFLELQSRKAIYFSSVSSIYLLFYDDFGYWGTFIFLILIVLLTQIIYVRWFGKKHNSFFSIYIFFIFFVLWSNSIMDPVFATGFIRSSLYSIATIEVLIYVRSQFFRRKLILKPQIEFTK